jgi:signal transduction histidine kinase/CheY-like chemotaxis protein/CHASE3 domain sensor protein
MYTAMTRIWFERLLVLLLFLIQGIVLYVGIVNYHRMNDVINAAGAPVQTSDGVELERDIMVDINSAERSAKSFYLTRKGNYLSEYFTLVYRVSPKIERLDTLKWDSQEKELLTDSLIHYFEDQLILLNDLIYLENNEHVTDELEAISITAERLRIDSLWIPVQNIGTEGGSKEVKRNFLDRLFGRNTKRVDPAPDTITQYKKIASLNSAENQIKKEVVKVRSVQTDKLKKIKEDEFELMEKIVFVSGEIQRLMNRTVLSETAIIRSRNDHALKMAEEARRINVIYSVTILVLLLVGSIIIIRYFILNGRQRKYLKKEREIAVRFAQAKQNLIANISHEMRTPLNSIIGFANLLWQKQLPGEHSEELNAIRVSSNHLLKVINDILDNSRLEAGMLKLNSHVFSPRDKLKEVGAIMKIQAAEKGLFFEEEFSDDLPDNVHGDSLRFAQVLLNILGNAVKYTHVGGVKTVAGYESGKLKIIVSDTGTGIPEDRLHSMFNRFEQASEKLAGSGAGLGLNIAKQLVELQKGSIDLKSELNKGTTVTLLIPMDPVESDLTPLNDLSTTVLQSDLSKVKILIADDEAFNRLLLKRMLLKYGNTPEEAVNGAEVLELLKHRRFDIILMDVRMPVLNGLETTREIRKMNDQNIARIPIIALTAGIESEKREKCTAAGMNIMLSKPYTETSLITSINSLLIKES